MPEYREVPEIRIFKLILNSIFDNCECATIVAISDDYDRLVSFYNEHKVAQYPDKPFGENGYTYRKNFRKGSPLENYNQPFSLEVNQCDHYGHGIQDEWVRLHVWEHIQHEGRFTLV